MHPTHSAVCSDELLTHCTTFRAQNQARSIFYGFLKKIDSQPVCALACLLACLPLRVATRSPDVL